MYSYSHLMKDIRAIEENPSVFVGMIGKSVLGREIPLIRVGNGPYRFFFCGAHHGSEWITSMLIMRFYKEELSARPLSPLASVYLVPMVNPDGVELSLCGASSAGPFSSEVLRINGGANFTHWQANIRGVDLNHNYAAGFKAGKEDEKSLGILGPAPSRYSGPFPESEPESRALANLTRRERFCSSIAFHSQGEVIYWDYLGTAAPEAKVLAQKMAAVSGYALDRPEGFSSYGGYKDWVIDAFRVPSYTVEVGLGENPLPEEDLEDICRRTFPLFWEMIGFMIDKNTKKMYTG